MLEVEVKELKLESSELLVYSLDFPVIQLVVQEARVLVVRIA